MNMMTPLMTSSSTSWLEIHRGDAPLVVSFPHTGLDIPAPFDWGMVSRDVSLRDTDWHIEKLYGFARDMGATTIRTRVSRSVIDVNRDPTGASLYPGQATTGLCPLTTFDGDPLYHPGFEPDEDSISDRRALYFEPYDAALADEIARLRRHHDTVVLYDCHSIRSVVPRLFEDRLPVLNIGTNGGQSCSPELRESLGAMAYSSGFSSIMDGRFKGGWITRHHGQPANAVHAVQMELAMRGYLLDENDPAVFDDEFAAPLRAVLTTLLQACLAFAEAGVSEGAP
jgi:N-formylglutamate deformylase